MKGDVGEEAQDPSANDRRETVQLRAIGVLAEPLLPDPLRPRGRHGSPTGPRTRAVGEGSRCRRTGGNPGGPPVPRSGISRGWLGLRSVCARYSVLSEVFPGNRNDMETFPEVFEALFKRLQHLEVATEKLLLVVDRGVNSVENFDQVLGVVHVVAALKRNEAKGLLDVPLEKFRTVGRDTDEEPVLGYAAEHEGFGRSWRALVTYRRAEAAHATAQWEKAKTKVLPQVAAWRQGRPHTKQKVAMTKVVDLIPREYRGIFDYGVEEVWVRNTKGQEVRRYRPRCEVSPKAESELVASFGKAVIITDLGRTELPDEQLLEASVARTQIEEQFKWLKDRYVLAIKPVWVWHDANIPGHLFLCVMGLTLLRYLQWEARELQLSVKELVERLGKIRLAVVNQNGRPHWVLEEMDMESAELVSRFQLLEQMPRESQSA